MLYTFPSRDNTDAASARSQGLSDGYHSYSRNPGDFTGRALDAYNAGYDSGCAQSPFARNRVATAAGDASVVHA